MVRALIRHGRERPLQLLPSGLRQPDRCFQTSWFKRSLGTKMDSTGDLLLSLDWREKEKGIVGNGS